MTPPRLLALTTSREEGGAETHLRVTLAEVAARGYEVHAAFPGAPAGTARLREDLRAGGLRVHALALGRPTRSRAGAYFAIAADAATTLAMIARVRPDAVLVNLPTPEASPGALLACALARVRTTAIFHLVRSDFRVTPMRRRMYRALGRSRQSWVCVSQDNRATLAAGFGVAPERIAVVRNGAAHAPPAAFGREEVLGTLGIPADAVVVLTTGRLGEQKGHRLIVAALPRLVALEERLVFVWAGDGPLRAELTDAVSGLGLERHVRVLGRRDDVPALLAAADLFLMPSRDEGAPLALIEAMLAGVPALVSDVGALTEIIEDGGNGLVFQSGDADALVATLARALGHRHELAQMASRAREQAQAELTLERMLERLMPHVLPPGGPGP